MKSQEKFKVKVLLKNKLVMLKSNLDSNLKYILLNSSLQHNKTPLF